MSESYRGNEKGLNRLMISKYIVLLEDLAVEEGVGEWRERVSDARVAYNIYVVDSRGRLKGVLTLRELLAADPKSLIKNVMRKDFAYAHIDDTAERVASIAIRNHVCAVPILDRDHKLLGIVSADDILNAVRMESNRCVYRLAGILGLEPKLGDLRNILTMVKARIPWLIITLIIGVFVSGGIIKMFEDTLSALPVIAVFIPVLMASGGNVSIQSSTLLVRTLAVERISTRSRAFRLLAADLGVGGVIGLILGACIFTLSLWWLGDPRLATTLFLSTFTICIVATGIGFVIPYLSHIAKIDPALTSGPIVTLIKDVASLLIYFIAVMVIFFP